MIDHQEHQATGDNMYLTNREIEEGWFSPRYFLPQINQLVDFVFQGPKVPMRCLATWVDQNGVRGFRTLAGYIQPEAVLRWKPVSGGDPIEVFTEAVSYKVKKQKRKWNGSPEERKRRSEHMKALRAKFKFQMAPIAEDNEAKPDDYLETGGTISHA